MLNTKIGLDYLDARILLQDFNKNILTIYLASIKDKAMIACCFEYQLIGPPLSMKMKPVVDFWLSLPLAYQSLSISQQAVCLGH